MGKDDLKDNLEVAKKVLAPWWPGPERTHRHLVFALIGLGMIPLIRPDMHVEYLLGTWLLVPLMSPRVRATIAGWFGRG